MLRGWQHENVVDRREKSEEDICERGELEELGQRREGGVELCELPTALVPEDSLGQQLDYYFPL